MSMRNFRCLVLLMLGAWVWSLDVRAEEAMPDFYQEPGLYPNRDYLNQGFNEHIDPFTGGLQLHYVDLHLPGNGGFDLTVVRSYNSANVDIVRSDQGQAGVGWTVHFGRIKQKAHSLTPCTNYYPNSQVDNPVLELPDGTVQQLSFTSSGAPLMLTTQRWKAECIGSGDGLAVYAPDGTRYDMTQKVRVSNAGAGTEPPIDAWYTTRITDKNGNYATISYKLTGSPEIASVTTSDGRSLSFSYLDSGAYTARISQITGATGQTWSYSYQPVTGYAARNFLTRVQRPDGTSWNYEYNLGMGTAGGDFLVKKVTYPQGGSIAYSYQRIHSNPSVNALYEFTAVSRKTSSDGGVWSFTYVPGAPGAYDTTRVDTPAGPITYTHVGGGYIGLGSVWMMGLLISKDVGGVYREDYTWDKQLISEEDNFRSGGLYAKVDPQTYSPILTKKNIGRSGATYTTNYSNFDSYGNPGTVSESGTDGGNRTTNLTYYINTAKWIVKQVKDESFGGGTTSRTFDGNGNLTVITRDGVTTQYSYDSQGNVTSITLPRSLTTSYSSYMRGIARTESQPEGVSISRAVSSAGNVTSETNGEGNTTTYGYDGLNRITSINYPAGNSVSISYGASQKTVTRGSLSERTDYDGFGRPQSITLGGITRTFDYDALGRKTFESHPGSSAGTSYGYDILGRLTSVRNADGSSQSISYSGANKSVRDERGKTTTYSYRAYGNPDQEYLMSIAAPESGASVTFARNARDLVTSVTQGG